MTVYVVIRDSYGALTRPKGVWSERADAIDQAVSLSGGAEFTETPSDGYRAEGHAKRGTRSWEVVEYDLDTSDERSIDDSDNP